MFPIIILIVLMGGFGGCSSGDPMAGIRIEPGLEDLWEGLPDRPSLKENGPDAPLRVELLRCSWKTGRAPESKEKETLLAEKILAGRVFAPAVSFLDPRTSVNFNEIEKLSILPLEEIRLPKKALRVDGLLPGELGYRLAEKTVLRLSTGEGFDTPADPGLRAAADKLLKWIQTLPDAEAPVLTRVAGVGDLMLGRGVDQLLRLSSGTKKVFQDLLPLLQDQDLTLGNLEGALTKRSKTTPKSYNFRFPPEVLGVLAEAGFDYLSPANNHVFDFGEAGFLDTISAFDAAGMPFSGAGRNLEEAAEPWKGRAGGQDFLILSLGAYPAEGAGFDGLRDAAARSDRPGILWAGDTALNSMKKNFSPGTFDVVLVHGGFEWQNEPSPAQISLYRSFIDAGADLVLGSHPHVLQAVETYKGKLIAYSLGNFIFPGMDETKYGEESLVLTLCLFQDEVRYVEFHPARLEGRTVRRDETGNVLERFLRLCRAFRPPVQNSEVRSNAEINKRGIGEKKGFSCGLLL